MNTVNSLGLCPRQELRENPMSFMYNPYPYDDPDAINRIQVEPEIRDAILTGAAAAAIVMLVGIVVDRN
jgi:hypothetical protein